MIRSIFRLNINYTASFMKILIFKASYSSLQVCNPLFCVPLTKSYKKYSTQTKQYILKDIFGSDDITVVTSDFVSKYNKNLYESEQYYRIIVEAEILTPYYSQLINYDSLEYIYNSCSKLSSRFDEVFFKLLEEKKKEIPDIEIQYIDFVLKYHIKNENENEIKRLIDNLISKGQNKRLKISKTHLSKSLPIIFSRIYNNLYKVQIFSEILSTKEIIITNQMIEKILTNYYSNKQYEDIYSFVQILNTYCVMNINNKCLHYYLLSCAYLEKVDVFLDIDKQNNKNRNNEEYSEEYNENSNSNNNNNAYYSYLPTVLLFARIFTSNGYYENACKYWMKYITESKQPLSTNLYYNALHCFAKCKNKEGFKEIIMKGLLNSKTPKAIPICTSMMLYDLTFSDNSIIESVHKVYKLKTQNSLTYGMLEDLEKKKDRENMLWILQWLSKQI